MPPSDFCIPSISLALRVSRQGLSCSVAIWLPQRNHRNQFGASFDETITSSGRPVGDKTDSLNIVHTALTQVLVNYLT